MAYIRITVAATDHRAAQFSGTDFLQVAEDAVRQVKASLPMKTGISLQELAIFNSLDTDALADIAGLSAIKNGAAAGNITVTGISPDTDELVSVYKVHNIATDAGPPTITDLTSEFTITAANTINNTAGTASTGDCLVISYVRHS